MERKLKDRLREESRYDEKEKDEIWDRIEARLDDEPVVPSRAVRARNGGKGPVRFAFAVAVVFMAIGVFLAMPAGTAFMHELKTWFAPEKKVEVEVEGEKEKTDQQLHRNEEGRYAIYYDKERYKLVRQGGKDVITTKEPLPERYPEVSMTIEQMKDVAPEALIQQLSQELKGRFSEIKEIEKVSKPVEGYRVRALNGKEWNSEVVVLYAVGNGKQGSFAITERYFLEASEGHGARFSQMLKEFRVLND